MSIEIEKLSEWYGNVELDFDRELIVYRYQSVKQYFKGKSCLEIAPAQGVMTKYLAEDFEKMTLVEGSQNLLNQIPDYPNVQKFCSFIENWNSEDKFDTIIMDHILEHIENPVATLAHIHQFLKPGGVLIIGVPNALSFHRMLGVKMGFLHNEYELNSRDIELGHFRVYDIASLNEHVLQAGFEVMGNDGVYFKLLSNKQIQTTFDQKLKDGCFELGKEFKNHCAEIYCIATKK